MIKLAPTRAISIRSMVQKHPVEPNRLTLTFGKNNTNIFVVPMTEWLTDYTRSLDSKQVVSYAKSSWVVSRTHYIKVTSK